MPSMDSVNNEVEVVINDLKKITFSENVKIINIPTERQIEIENDENVDTNTVYMYDTNLGTPINHLELTIGAKNIPRYSCSNHKLLLAVRGAITRH